MTDDLILFAAAISISGLALAAYSSFRPYDRHKSGILLIGMMTAMPLAVKIDGGAGTYLLILAVSAMLAIVFSAGFHILQERRSLVDISENADKGSQIPGCNGIAASKFRQRSALYHLRDRMHH